MTVLLAVGDGATGGVDSAKLAANLAATKPDAFVWLGDVYEAGTAAEFAHNYAPSWGALDPVCWPVVGNHDWPNYATGFLPYFSAQSRLSWLSKTTQWSRVDLGDGWDLLLLNSEAELERQVEWVQGLPASVGRRRIACWHRPRYCSGSHGDASDLDPLWRAAAAGGCRVVLSGHAHNMQQFHPDATGCVQLVSGAGGRGLYAEVPGDPRLAWGEASGYGAVRLELGADGADGALSGRWVDENLGTLETFDA